MAKKKHHEGHGGAWKVAYADFVTAMMALFMVLWIIGQDSEVVKQTARYFQDPFVNTSEAVGVMPMDNNGNTFLAPKPQNSATQTLFLEELMKRLYEMLNLDQLDEIKPVEVQLEADGIHIILYDRPDQPLFKEGTDRLTKWGRFVVQTVAWVIDQYRDFMSLRIDAYTNGSPEKPPTYDPLELGTRRTLVMRTALEAAALSKGLIQELRSFTQAPESKENGPPFSPADQRVELSLVFLSKEEERQAAAEQISRNLDQVPPLSLLPKATAAPASQQSQKKGAHGEASPHEGGEK